MPTQFFEGDFVPEPEKKPSDNQNSKPKNLLLPDLSPAEQGFVEDLIKSGREDELWTSRRPIAMRMGPDLDSRGSAAERVKASKDDQHQK